MTITITGLTKQQYQIADMIWSCDSQEDVQRLLAAMPAQYKQDAQTVHELMIAAVMDQHEDITEDVKDIIRVIKTIADRS
jgi:hypothetical protein